MRRSVVVREVWMKTQLAEVQVLTQLDATPAGYVQDGSNITGTICV
jgi:hypothetical protein